MSYLDEYDAMSAAERAQLRAESQPFRVPRSDAPVTDEDFLRYIREDVPDYPEPF